MRIIVLILLFLTSIVAKSQHVIGKWKTIDDVTNEVKSVVEIFERNGKVFGKIVSIFPGPNEDQDPVCTKCSPEDKRYKQKIIGMEIMKDMQKDGDEYSGGEILDPESGKTYRCKIWTESGKLYVRGYWGPFFRTQIWQPHN